MRILSGIHGTPPILLIDDVMGELDVKRRSGFLPLLESARRMRGQVFMTCIRLRRRLRLGGWPQMSIFTYFLGKSQIFARLY